MPEVVSNISRVLPHAMAQALAAVISASPRPWRRARRKGLGAALMRAAEAQARECGKTLLMLDTTSGMDAERLYARLGWQRFGEVPGHALLPQGGLSNTAFFYRVL